MDDKDSLRQDRVSRSIMRKLIQSMLDNTQKTPGSLKRMLSSRDRDVFAEALESLMRSGDAGLTTQGYLYLKSKLDDEKNSSMERVIGALEAIAAALSQASDGN
jgi:hypothetical protein